MDTPIDDPSRRCPDISKAKRLLGWEPSTPLDQGLESTVTWFRTRLGISDQKDSALPAFSEPTETERKVEKVERCEVQCRDLCRWSAL
jgi:dTDP-D-glucose 4,6-dehydratase